MTIYERLAKAQRNFGVSVFIAWLAGFVAMVTLPPNIAIVVMAISIAAMVAAGVYLIRAARCPRCAASLWLSLHKIVPFGGIRRPTLKQCPSCGVSVSDPAQA